MVCRRLPCHPGRCILRYRFPLLRGNLADFEHLQVWAHDLLRSLKRRGVIAGYDQAAMLLHSVQEQEARPYLASPEKGGIPVRRVSAGDDGGGDHRTRRPALTVTTIHQAEGREWGVVIVGTLSFNNPDLDPVERESLPYLPRTPFEPQDRIADFDHARQRYVAFSRARHLPVLTAGALVHARFQDVWERLPRWNAMIPPSLSALARQRFNVPAPDRMVVDDAATRAPRVTRHVGGLDIRLGLGSIDR